MRVSTLLIVLVGVCALVHGVAAYGEYDYDYDFDVMGGAGLGGFGFGANVQPVLLQQLQQPVLQQGKKQQAVMLQQPVMQQTKSVRYAQPIVTYAQPIVEQVNMAQPIVQSKQHTAQAIIQPSFQTAPVQQVQAISTTAPTIQKGFGQNLGLGQVGAAGGYGGRYGGLNQFAGLQQQQQAFGGLNY